MSRVFEYTHDMLNREIFAIGGHYIFTKEETLIFDGRPLLYLSGYVMLDTSCCGNCGFGYALVQGFVNQLGFCKNSDGVSISQIEPIIGSSDQAEIGRIIRDKESVRQVGFRSDM